MLCWMNCQYSAFYLPTEPDARLLGHRACMQGWIKGRASQAVDWSTSLQRALKYYWNKSEIWCHLTQVVTRNSLHNWRKVNVNRKLVFPIPTR
jgi:hypothetical protein